MDKMAKKVIKPDPAEERCNWFMDKCNRLEAEVRDWKANSQELSEHLSGAMAEFKRMSQERDQTLGKLRAECDARIEADIRLGKEKSDHEEELRIKMAEAYFQGRLSETKQPHCWFCRLRARFQSWIPWLKAIEEPSARE